MKRDKYDAILSDIVRLRANFICEKCSIIDPEGQAKFKSLYMQASHFRGRGSGLIARFDTDNVRCLCASCHAFLENRPDDHAYFLENLLGETRYENMRSRCNKSIKLPKPLKEEMYYHYKSEYKRLVEMRKNGNTEYIELVNYF